MTRLVLCLCALLAACRPIGPGTLVVAPDAAAGQDGLRGPHGAARVSLRAQARVSDGINVEVTFPADAVGRLDGGPYPAVAFVHGGLVPRARYRWLAEHLATQGYVTVAAEYLFDLAIFETDNAWFALQAVRDEAAAPGGTLSGAILPSGKIIAMGHSLGGVIAVRQWLSHDLTALVLLAAYPADGDPVDDGVGRPVLSLVGSNDKKALPAQVRAGFETFEQPRLLGVVDGMIHYDWTDDASPSELGSDGTPGRPQADTRRDALRLLDTWLGAQIQEDPSAAARLAQPFDGVALSP